MLLLKYVINIKFLLILLLLLIKTKEYLVFPINSFHPNNFTKINNSNNFNNEDFLNYWLPNEMYTYLYIGSPPNKIYTYLYSEDYISYMDNSICHLSSKYDNESSSTFKPTSDYIVYFSGFSKMCFANETFSAYTDYELNKLKNMPNITFLYAVNPLNDTIYSKYYKEPVTGFSCFHLGLQLPASLDYYDLWVEQLKKNDYIESTYWTIEFNNKNKLFDISNENEGFLVVGLPPHKYKPNKFKETDFRSTTSKVRVKNYEDYRVNIWGIIFDEIYFYNSNSTHNETIILQTTKCIFSLDINLIEGSTVYLNNIENLFFNDLYNKSICFKERVRSLKNGLYYVIWCNKSNFDEIKKFPTLFFKSIELEYIFELTYKDLFAVNGDKIFFMIIFRSSEAMFTFGKLFYKKYSFTFSFDNKIIGFYKNELTENVNPNNNGNNNKNNLFIIILIIVLVIILIALIIIGYFIKKKFLNDRKKRVNELMDEDYVYESNKNNDSPDSPINY